MDVDSILKPYLRFGVHLGLERIHRLLGNLGNPHLSVPIIHVAGTNGKGSVCAYLSSVLTEAGYRVGRYTSPHLVEWNERICLNGQPIASEKLQQLLLHVQDAIETDTETPTQFEVFTAAAWLYFAQEKVDIAVIEVGLGGRLDATNVCDRPLVSIITSISREHWQQLGPTVADIAREKAGILKSGCPAVIGVVPPEAQAVIASRIAQLDCPAMWVQPARSIKQGWAEYPGNEEINVKSVEYPLPLPGEVQLNNSALAIAALQILSQQGWNIAEDAIVMGMAKTTWRGRLQWTSWKNRPLLIDGAHNPAAALALRHYVDTYGVSVTWVMGMLSTKEHDEIFKALLRKGDRLYLVPVPDRSSAQPEDLASLARTICPELAVIETYPDLFTGLDAAISKSSPEHLLVLCGSLYLLGYFLKQQLSANT